MHYMMEERKVGKREENQVSPMNMDEGHIDEQQ
jgi:hypothetical protein